MSKRIILTDHYSVRAIAVEMSTDPETVERKLAKLNLGTDDIFMRDLFKAFAGENKSSAMQKKIESETRLNDIEYDEKIGKLVDRAEVESEVWGQLLAFKNALFKIAKKHRMENEMDALLAEHWKGLK
jgi:hypothetical protein